MSAEEFNSLSFETRVEITDRLTGGDFICSRRQQSMGLEWFVGLRSYGSFFIEVWFSEPGGKLGSVQGIAAENLHPDFLSGINLGEIQE